MGLPATKLSAENSESNVEVCILFISRPNIRPVIRQELKVLGIEEIISTETKKACIDELNRNENALLIVDWEQGRDDINAVLRAAQGVFSVDTRPIFLIAAEVSQGIVATGSEYNVCRIHTGEISRTAIQDHLVAILEQENDPDGLRAGLARAAEARHRGDLPMTSVILADLTRRHPDVPRVGCELADARIEQDQWDEALETTEKLIVRAPDDLRVQHLHARCLMHEGCFQEATEILQRTKLVNPLHVDRLLDLGRALIQIDSIKEALATFDEVLDIDASNIEATRGKGECKLIEGDVNDALVLLRQVSGNREMASIFNNAAILAIRNGRFAEGVNLYQSALGSIGAKNRIQARLFFNLGIAYHKWKRLDEALECFEQGFSMDTLFDKCRHNAKILAGLLGRRAQLTNDAPSDAIDPAHQAEAVVQNHQFTQDFSDFEELDQDP